MYLATNSVKVKPRLYSLVFALFFPILLQILLVNLYSKHRKTAN